MMITPRIGADMWLEVEYSEGRFFVHVDASVWDLVAKMQEGGFWVAPPTQSKKRKASTR